MLWYAFRDYEANDILRLKFDFSITSQSNGNLVFVQLGYNWKKSAVDLDLESKIFSVLEGSSKKLSCIGFDFS